MLREVEVSQLWSTRGKSNGLTCRNPSQSPPRQVKNHTERLLVGAVGIGSVRHGQRTVVDARVLGEGIVAGKQAWWMEGQQAM